MTYEILIFIIEFNDIEMQQQLLLAQLMTSVKVLKQRQFEVLYKLYVYVYEYRYVRMYLCTLVCWCVCM
jgi:hypothetical protein